MGEESNDLVGELIRQLFVIVDPVVVFGVVVSALDGHHVVVEALDRGTDFVHRESVRVEENSVGVGRESEERSAGDQSELHSPIDELIEVLGNHRQVEIENVTFASLANGMNDLSLEFWGGVDLVDLLFDGSEGRSLHINLRKFFYHRADGMSGFEVAIILRGVIESEEPSDKVGLVASDQRCVAGSETVTGQGGGGDLVSVHESLDISNEVFSIVGSGGAIVTVAEVSGVKNVNVSVIEDSVLRMSEERNPVLDGIEHVGEKDQVGHILVVRTQSDSAQVDIG